MLYGLNEDFAFPLMIPRKTLTMGSRKIDGVTGKHVVVTGAGGSIGSELVRQIAEAAPKSLHLIDHSEEGLYEIMCTLEDSNADFPVKGYLNDIRSRSIVEVLSDQIGQIDVIFHAAALKHVPLLQTPHNLTEALRTNVLGTVNMASFAAHHGADFVQISTDKAVNPMSFMGLTKRLAECQIQNLSSQGIAGRRLITRFGNVLGSSGSVVPRFRRQIAQGGPVTVTHPDMVRYFMTIRQAVTLVLKSLKYASYSRANVCILDMGEPVKIVDLAYRLIRDAGLEPNEDIDVVFTGMRPGEKLFEELVYPFEKLIETDDGINVHYDDSYHAGTLKDECAMIRQMIVDREFEPLMTRLAQRYEDWPIFKGEAYV